MVTSSHTTESSTGHKTQCNDNYVWVSHAKVSATAKAHNALLGVRALDENAPAQHIVPIR